MDTQKAPNKKKTLRTTNKIWDLEGQARSKTWSRLHVQRAPDSSGTEEEWSRPHADGMGTKVEQSENN
jgi:hypothetical protein